MAEKKLRPGQKIKMVSVDELLGCAGEESSLEIDINRIQQRWMIWSTVSGRMACLRRCS